MTTAPSTAPLEAAAEWSMWDTTVRVVVTDPKRIEAARILMLGHLEAVDRACNRFRPDSEISRLPAARGREVPISGVFAEYLRMALEVARDTDGDVDPTVGAALRGLGYDRDLAAIDRRFRQRVVAVPRIDWRSVVLTRETVRVPRGVHLDLGATAKAAAADRCAHRIAERLGCGALVSLGGDIATAGPAPTGGWQVLVQDGAGEPVSRVALPAGSAVATSSTLRRRWRSGGRAVHHIVDPRTGGCAAPAWRTVSVAAGSCLAANAASTAAVVRGTAAVGRLRRSGLPVRLVDLAGHVTTLGGWP